MPFKCEGCGAKMYDPHAIHTITVNGGSNMYDQEQIATIKTCVTCYEEIKQYLKEKFKETKETV